MLKVGLIIYGSLNQTTGGYLYDRKMVDHLRKKGEEVEVISIDKKNYFQNIRDNFDRRLYEKLLNLEIDLLLQDELNHPSLFHLNEKLQGKLKYPIMSIIHHLSHLGATDREMREAYRFFERNYLSTIDEFVLNSKTTKSDVKSLIGETKGIVAHPGKDHIEPEKVGKIEGEKIQALFVGSITPRKGLSTLIKALGKTEEFFLTVVGNKKADQAYTKKIQNIIKRKGLNPRIELTGLVSENRIDEIYKRSDFLVVPSLYEGYGIVYAEALGYGLPVIASKEGGASEIITHGEEGFLAEPSNVEKLETYLEKLRDRKKISEMSKKARKRYAQLPTWKETMDRIIKYLRSIA